LADWIIDNKLTCHTNRWMIQIPRLYAPYKKNKIIENF
jgi:adenosine deaminase